MKSGLDARGAQRVAEEKSAFKTTPPLRRRPVRVVSRTLPRSGDQRLSYVVGLLLILVPLLVGSGLGLVRRALLVAQSLPPLTEDLADLAESDARVLLANVLTLLVGEEHVGGQATLGCVGVYIDRSASTCDLNAHARACACINTRCLPFLARRAPFSAFLVLAAAFGILSK